MDQRELREHSLSGQKFNRLSALGDDGTRKFGDIYLLCECECGTLVHAPGWRLKSGRVKSCGCLNQELKRSRFKDLTGDEDDNFKVIRRIGSKNSKALWEVVCKHCGNLAELTGNDMQHQSSCGCGRTGATKEFMDSIRNPDSRKSTRPTIKSRTGVRGVYFNKRKSTYTAVINVNRKQVYLGSSKDFEKAVALRKDAEKKYGYKDPKSK